MKLPTSKAIKIGILILSISLLLFLMISLIRIFVLPYYRPVVVETKDYIFVLSGNEALPYRYVGHDKNVRVPDSFMGKEITSIGEFCFCANNYLESVEIPDAVRTVDEFTFRGCVNLVSVKAKNIVVVERGAFGEDKNLKNVDLGTHLEEIGDSAFMYCKSLKSIPSQGSLKKIGRSAFWKSGITDIGDLSRVNVDSHSIFDDTPWMEKQEEDYVIINNVLQGYKGDKNVLVIPKGVEVIATDFPNETITVYLPESVKKITEPWLLADINYTVYIPESVEYIFDGYGFNHSSKIITVSGSYAEQFAIDHNLDYEIVDGWEVPEE